MLGCVAKLQSRQNAPRLSRLAIDVAPVPTDVVAATIFFLVRRSNCGKSSRSAAVKAPEVITVKGSEGSIIVLSGPHPRSVEEAGTVA